MRASGVISSQLGIDFRKSVPSEVAADWPESNEALAKSVTEAHRKIASQPDKFHYVPLRLEIQFAHLASLVRAYTLSETAGRARLAFRQPRILSADGALLIDRVAPGAREDCR